jgi:hypothetical protein
VSAPHKQKENASYFMPLNTRPNAKVMIDNKPYSVRIMATVKRANGRTALQSKEYVEREERRIWRVIYYHLKSVFEAAELRYVEGRIDDLRRNRGSN